MSDGQFPLRVEGACNIYMNLFYCNFVNGAQRSCATDMQVNAAKVKDVP